MEPRPHPFAAKLTLNQAEEVRRLRARGLRLAELAERFRIAKSSVSAIVHFHAHIPDGILRVALPTGDLDLLRELAEDEGVSVEQFAATLLIQLLRSKAW
jgi:transcriptional regulator with XRE-family HTH domain